MSGPPDPQVLFYGMAGQIGFRARFRGLPTSGSVCSTTASPSDSVPRGSGCVSSCSIVPLESFNDNLLYFVTQKVSTLMILLGGKRVNGSRSKDV